MHIRPPCMRILTHACAYVLMHAHTYRCICTYLPMHVHTYRCMYIPTDRCRRAPLRDELHGRRRRALATAPPAITYHHGRANRRGCIWHSPLWHLPQPAGRHQADEDGAWLTAVFTACMHVGMYAYRACGHVCVWACMYACAHVCMWLCGHVCTRQLLVWRVHRLKPSETCQLYACACMPMHMHACLCMCMHAHVCVHAHAHA